MGTHDGRELNRPRWEFSLDETREPFPIATYRVADETYPNFVVMSDGQVKFSAAGSAVPTGTAIVELTSAFGTANNALADVGAAFNQGTLNDNFKDLVAKVEEIRDVLVAAGLVV